MFPFEPWSKKQKMFNKVAVAWNDANEKLALLKALEKKKASRGVVTKAYGKWMEAMTTAIAESNKFMTDGVKE